MTFEINQVHGVSFPGQSLTGGLNFYVFRTLINITPTVTGDKTNIGVFDQSTANISNTAQDALNFLIQTISTRAQPVIIGKVVTTTETSPSDLPAASGSVTVYNLKYAIEHDQACELNNGNPNLISSLNGLFGFVYLTSPTTGNNCSLTLDTLLV